MDKKRIGLIAIITTLLVVATSVSRRTDPGSDVAEMPPSHTRSENLASTPSKSVETDGTSELRSSGPRTGTDPGKPLATEADFGAMELSQDENKNLEAFLVDFENGSLNAARLQELGSDPMFDELVAQLRDEHSEISNENRRKYELIFYSQPKSRDGTVALDTMECGNHLCVAELRADNKAVLDAYIENAIQSDAFEARAFLYPPGSDIYSSGESRRILFPHDPNIVGVTLPAGTSISADRLEADR